MNVHKTPSRVTGKSGFSKFFSNRGFTLDKPDPRMLSYACAIKRMEQTSMANSTNGARGVISGPHNNDDIEACMKSGSLFDYDGECTYVIDIDDADAERLDKRFGEHFTRCD